MKKTALITGGSRGIGKAIALKFAKEGYHIIISGSKNEEALLQTQKEIEAYHVSCLAYLGDMGNYEDVCNMFEKIKEQFGTIDVLINNAGISYVGLFTDMKPDEWNKLISTNLTSVINCCHLAVPMFVHKKEGAIINISSMWGVAGASCEVVYSATKGGINAFTKALGKELAPSNITVNAVACGVIDTEMNQCFSKEERDALTDEIPAGRMAAPSEVAEFVYSLCQGHTYLTGQVITFDGGFL